jgi:hypothetical protein
MQATSPLHLPVRMLWSPTYLAAVRVCSQKRHLLMEKHTSLPTPLVAPDTLAMGKHKKMLLTKAEKKSTVKAYSNPYDVTSKYIKKLIKGKTKKKKK